MSTPLTVGGFSGTSRLKLRRPRSWLTWTQLLLSITSPLHRTYEPFRLGAPVIRPQNLGRGTQLRLVAGNSCPFLVRCAQAVGTVVRAGAVRPLGKEREQERGCGEGNGDPER